MGGSYRVNKRKACDLCFHKKIKCDMLKPACSNCQLYNAPCNTTTVRKPFGHARSLNDKSPSVPAVSNNENDRMASIEVRLASLEEKLSNTNAMTPMTASFHQNQADPHFNAALTATPITQYLADVGNTLPDVADQILGEPGSILAAPGVSATPNASCEIVGDTDATNTVVNDSYPHLPPLSEIQPAIDHYFANVNSLIPLFNQQVFIRMLQGYYSFNCRNSREFWAAVNVVLALAARQPTLPSNHHDLGSGNKQVAKYISNVQSVLPELVTQEVDILGLQVILGLVIITHTLKDSSPAVTFVGMAVRFAHRLRLHIRQGQDHLSREDAIQRTRVFWITYLFDRDICLRYHTPSIQADEDIDLDLPSETPPDRAGNVYTESGQAHINFFRVRLHLAHIQGRVYNLLFAARAAKITQQERLARIDFLHKQLEDWRLSLPSEFQAERAVDSVSRTALPWICMMHFSYLSCLVMIHGIWSHDSEWRKRLTAGLTSASITTGTSNEPPLPARLPKGWRNCVWMSRNCMKLIQRMPLSDCCVWANGCAYFSALLILEANLIEHPVHDKVDSDLQLTSYAVSLLDKMSDVSSLMAMKRMNVVAAELDRRARQVISEARQSTGRASVPSTGYTGSSTVGFANGNSTPGVSKLEWNWGDSGVDAWPSMDFSIKEKSDTMIEMDNLFTNSGPFMEFSGSRY